ncbi:MAG: WD40 repeat domain-containing protein, partial [bacterium]
MKKNLFPAHIATSTLITLFTLFINIFFANTCLGTNFFENTSWSITGTIQINNYDWHPNGKHLAVAWHNNADNLRVYSFDGSNLTSIVTKRLGAMCAAVSWSPNGTYLATGTDGTTNFAVWTFNGTTLTSAATPVTITSYLHSIDWHPSGNYIAVGYYTGSAGRFQVYRFTGSSLTPLGAAIQPTGNSELWVVKWSPDGNFLAVGNRQESTTKNLEVYNFNPSASTPLTVTAANQKNYGPSYLFSVAWRPDGKYLAI